MPAEPQLRLQVLPNASEETLQQLETNLAALPPISQLLQDGNSVADITAQILGPLGVQEESTTSITPRWACCSACDAYGLYARQSPLLLWCVVEARFDILLRAACCRFGPCEPESLKERMKRAVALLGKDEVNEIVRSEGKIEVQPVFCRASLHEFVHGSSPRGALQPTLHLQWWTSLDVHVQVECEFCKEQYVFSEAEVLEVLGR